MTRLYPPISAPDVDDIPVAVWVGKAPDGEILYANPALFDLLGMSRPRSEWPTLRSGSTASPQGRIDSGERDELEAFARLPFRRAMQARTTVIVDDMIIDRADGSSSDAD